MIAIVGSFALLFAIATAVFVGIRTLGTGDSTQSETMNGVTALDIESSGAQFTLTYGNVDEAVLSVRAAASGGCTVPVRRSRCDPRCAGSAGGSTTRSV
ncbi:hypothetical protein [Microbacterium sp. NIBRBAC000506063]|uniref:hypothetical protein n=1 Tax=Microbacterium sp. NIBRBAC000506063 TaxID=2734618 RepID=UPI001BB5BFEE|nr:hypothetical protein [Microbacterium sp. NIBRBAC000506063]QTV80414.1 hypothetical protein KAE78_05665 [Microbacterium sp. NIBRBAC000506063]